MKYLVYVENRHRRTFSSIAEANTWTDYKKRQHGGGLSRFTRVQMDDGTTREITAEEVKDKSTTDLQHVLTAMDTTALGLAIDDNGPEGLVRYVGELIRDLALTGAGAEDAAPNGRLIVEQHLEEAGRVLPLLTKPEDADTRRVVELFTLMLTEAPARP
jgi:hypothetical protein